MCAHKVTEPRTRGSQIEASLTWVGGGERRELHEHHERSAHAIAGVVVILNAALAWLAQDYPELFTVPGLDRRLWRYALAYTIRHIVFWPPDRAEGDGLDPGHPLHTLRRLVDAPLPLPVR